MGGGGYDAVWRTAALCLLEMLHGGYIQSRKLEEKNKSILFTPFGNLETQKPSVGPMNTWLSPNRTSLHSCWSFDSGSVGRLTTWLCGRFPNKHGPKVTFTSLQVTCVTVGCVSGRVLPGPDTSALSHGSPPTVYGDIVAIYTISLQLWWCWALTL